MKDKINENRILESIGHRFRPFELAKILSFEDAMRLAYKLLCHDTWYDPWRHYAIEVLYSIRDHFPEQWSSSWRYDAFLGMALDFAGRYREKYVAYKDAMEKASPPPPELLTAVASCQGEPGNPMTENQALTILTEIAKKKPYISIIRMLVKGAFKSLTPNELAHWTDLYNHLKNLKENEELPQMTPGFLTTGIETDLINIQDPPRQDRIYELCTIAKIVFSSQNLPSSVRGIAANWEKDSIIIRVYHTNKLNAETQSKISTAYTRIASCYLMDYVEANIREYQIDSDIELPQGKVWVFRPKERGI